MKRFLTAVVLGLLCSTSFCQVFDRKIVVDKFDDIVSTKEQKTLINFGETKDVKSVTIEEKGQDPVTYLLREDPILVGGEDDIVNLVDNIYGYEEIYLAIRDSDLDKVVEEMENGTYDRDKTFEKYVIIISHRVVTDRYGYSKKAELVQVYESTNVGNCSKTIYCKSM